MVNVINYLSNLKPIKAYINSLNSYIKNPLMFIPFALETVIPIFVTSTVILLVMGVQGLELYYAETIIIADPLAGPKLFFSIMLSAIASSFIISFFDAAGLSMVAMSVKKKSSLSSAWNKGRGLFIKQITVFLLLALTGIGLIFPLLFFITFGISPVIYVFYSFGATIFYLMCLLYPRVVSVAEKGSGFKAFFDGIRFSFTNLPHVIGCLLIIAIVFGALSLISALSPQVYYLVFVIFLFPWLNSFLVHSYLIKR